MAVDVAKVRLYLGNDSLPAEKILAAEEVAERLLRNYGVSENDCDRDLMLTYLCCHVLFLQNEGREVASKSVGDVSVSYSPLGGRNSPGWSPFYEIFLGLLKSSDFVISP